MKDGDIDYSGFSPSELQQALDGINPEAFPKNYENLKVALRLAFPQLATVEKGTTKAKRGKEQNYDKKAAYDFYYSTKASIASVVGAGAFLSDPNSYLYALISIPVALSAYGTLKNKKSKLLHLSCFVAVSLYSFIVGRIFHENNQLTNFGLLAMLVPLCAALYLFGMLYVYEKERAT